MEQWLYSSIQRSAQPKDRELNPFLYKLQAIVLRFGSLTDSRPQREVILRKLRTALICCCELVGGFVQRRLHMREMRLDGG